MKLKLFTLFFVFLGLCQIRAYSQSYSLDDINALNVIQQSCDPNYRLNWRGDVPNQYWEGVTWWLDGEVNQYRVSELNLANKNISGNLVVKDLYYLTNLQCQNNSLKGLTIENCPSLNILNCAVNQLPISELVKYVYLGSNFTYNPQAAVFEEKTHMPGYVIDYSSQADGGNTTFVFRNRSKPGNDGSEIVEVNNTGIYTTQEVGVYFCEMANQKLSQNNFYSHTANINISVTPAIILTVENGHEGEEFTFSLSANTDNTPIFIDFGDGALVPKTIGPETIKIDGIIGNSSVIKIYGGGINALDCNSINLSSLDVTNCPSLVYLFCWNNKLTTLNVSNNPKLNYLNCESNNLKALDLSNNLVLEVLYCHDNIIAEMNLSNSRNLVVLNCYNNSLTSLDVSNKPNLESIYCSNNNIRILDVSNSPKLDFFYCDNNHLTTLDVSNNPVLSNFGCEYNHLVSLDVSKNPNLKYLYCGSNNLKTIDLSKNSSLEVLWCYNNNLITLNVSNNPNLNYLDCTTNHFTNLDVSNNTKLRNLYCENNNLKSLYVNKNTHLNTLYCRGNKLPISELLQFLKDSIDFMYCPQYDVFDEATYSTNVTLDYSAQADGSNTVFYFRNRSLPGADGCAVVAINNTGVYTTQGGGVYFCEMANPKLDQNGFYSHTANVTIDLPVDFSLKDLLAEESITAVGEESAEPFMVYPNPVNDIVHIALHSTDLPATITIYSIEGKQLMSIEATSAQTNIDMDGLEKGTYIIKIETSKEQINKKIVKM